MAFQTNVFRDGEWVTETVNLHAVLRSQKAGPKTASKQDPLKPTPCGILTTTLVDSSLVNSILPARLRSANSNDIVFVGDDFVEVCELRQDGRLKTIIQKHNFGCGIRNACVVGAPVIPELKDDGDDAAVKSEPDLADSFGLVSSARPTTASAFPPQMLMIVLETGNLVFLLARPRLDGHHELVASRYQNPHAFEGHLGFHAAVDPSSRYAALASPTDYFVIYELESRETLQERYLLGEPLAPVRSFRRRAVRGVIHKMTFLHPRPGDDHHIILLLVIVRHGRSKTVIYEWELGDDLRTVFADEKPGHRMPLEYQMPLLLVPLTVHSAFLVITEQQIAVCTECLHGPPKFDPIDMVHLASHRPRGPHPPLWTAWARPFRLQSYKKNRDCVYLAREDGVVLFMEADQESPVAQCTPIDPFPCAISTAFACVFDRSTDVLLLGSNSGPGGYWKIPPRQPCQLMGTLTNWTPILDFTTTGDIPESNSGAARSDKALAPWQHGKPRKPDRIFAVCGDGTEGAIVEYRYGLKASIGLDLEFGADMKQAWLLPLSEGPLVDGYLLLLAMPDSTAGLILPSDFSGTTTVDEGMTPYDLSSTTLALEVEGQWKVQVTKEKIVLVNQQGSTSISLQDIPGLLTADVSDACVLDNAVAISTHTDARFQIHVFSIDPAQLTVTPAQTIDVDGEVTCLSLSACDSGRPGTLLAAVRKNSETLLAYARLDQLDGGLRMVNLVEHLLKHDGSADQNLTSLLEGIDSIVSVRGTVLLGTRSGEVISVKHNADSTISVDCEKFGGVTARVSCSYGEGAAEPTVFVCCDDSLVSVSLDRHASRPDDAVRLKNKLRVWPVDASKPDASSPPVHFAKVVDMPCEDGVTPIMIVSGSRLLLAEMHPDPGLVYRSIPVPGLPTKVMYCHFTQCLVVGVTKPSGPTLLLINPDTGEDIGRPTDKNNLPQQTISGLGKEKDKILCLAEWIHKKDANTWNFLLVGTKAGRLIIVSTDKLPSPTTPPKTRYWTKFKRDLKDPIYSIIGHRDGVVYCAGTTIHWEVLDPVERRLKPLKSITLDSPATGLRVVHDNKVVALTYGDSLVVLDSADGGSEEEVRVRHVDPWRRGGADFVEVAGPPPPPAHPGANQPSTSADASTRDNNNPNPNNSIYLVADRARGVGGLWIPWSTPERECETVLEAEVGASVRRFRKGRTKPAWERRGWGGGDGNGSGNGPRFGRLAATGDDAEVLGVALNGSLRRFVMLEVEGWRLLKFVEGLARGGELGRGEERGKGRDGEEGEAEGEAEAENPEPRGVGGLEMQVDGDVLRGCLERRALERLVVKEAHVVRFVELLGELDGGVHTAGWREEGGDVARYFRLAYEVLEYYLAPAF